MQLFDITSIRTKALSLITSAVLMLLLGWQSNLKSTQFEKSYAAASQATADASKESLDLNDFDPAVLLSALPFELQNHCCEIVVALQTSPFSHSYIPQSRAPPVFL